MKKYTGVSFKPHQGKWVATLFVNSVGLNVGSYDTQEKAVIARDKMIMKMGLPHSKLQKFKPKKTAA
jgi:hypothetical protein